MRQPLPPVQPDAAPAEARPSGPGALFLAFLMLGLTGFGGVLPLARRALVERRRWLSGEEFSELLGLCQFLPGGNIINLSVAVGLEFFGIAGAFASLLGLVAAPTAIVVALGAIYDRVHGDPRLTHLFAGLAAGAAGLLAATALRVLAPIARRLLPMLVVAAVFVAIAVLRLPLLPTMLVGAPLGVLAMRRRP